MEGSQVGHGPVAPLVEALAGGVEKDLAEVLHDGEMNLVDGTGLRQPAKAVLCAQAVHRRLLHDRLAVRHRVELTVQTVALDGEGALLRHEVLEGDALDALVQLLKGAGLKGGQQDHDPLAGAEAEVGPGHVGEGAVKKNAAVLGADVCHVEAAKLRGGQALQAEETGNAKSEVFHGGSSR